MNLSEQFPPWKPGNLRISCGDTICNTDGVLLYVLYISWCWIKKATFFWSPYRHVRSGEFVPPEKRCNSSMSGFMFPRCCLVNMRPRNMFLVHVHSMHLIGCWCILDLSDRWIRLK
jgi:hypothetical protein